MTDFMLDAHSYPIPVSHWFNAQHPFYHTGKWCEPHLEAGHHLLRHVKANYGEALEKGRRAAEFVRRYGLQPVVDRWEFVLQHLNEPAQALQEFSERYEKLKYVEEQAGVDAVFGD